MVDLSPTENKTSGASASSLDGRQFHFQTSAASAVEVGALVTLTDHIGVQVGQIVGVSSSSEDELEGFGTILGEVGPDDNLDRRSSRAFTTAVARRANSAIVELVYGSAGKSLRIGSLLANPDIDGRVLSQRFNRHTFWCGQSGSGKTYALGVLLEQILVHTALPMVIFDPNSDFVRLREHRTVEEGSGASHDQDQLRERAVRVLRPSSAAPDSLCVRFTSLPLRGKAAVLRLDPLEDRAEFNELVHLEITSGSQESSSIVSDLRERNTAASLALADRIENLRIVDWGVWAGEHEAVTEILERRPDATVLDLGGFSFSDEQLVTAMAVLDDLWAKRETRRPILIVIDEAHNLCSPEETSPLHRAVRERIIQIAAEGRKFGLWLLLSTQRPSKIHPNILSQCDNLALMRMSSPLDLAELAEVFGFAPRAMLDHSPFFRQGEALFAGGFVAAPTLLQVGDRLTVEGGIDVSVPTR